VKFKIVQAKFYLIEANTSRNMSRGKERANDLPVHKVIMVGSGGVGKSALTLQFMYDEVSISVDSFAIQFPFNLKVCRRLRTNEGGQLP